ncbi:18882_t:CDS:1 [Acaulospora morrowiae]|uniref:18882_t:CDS:1 n=1 Tax=Acaulospora morrowiae TaxID=94023 RepID=A0A9N8ZZF1_9GLOM|nr:18882_t:CDS:1 [Acaulospora morrowiae]
MSPSIRERARHYTTLACEQCKKSKTRCVQSTEVHIPIVNESNSSNSQSKGSNDCPNVKQEQKVPGEHVSSFGIIGNSNEISRTQGNSEIFIKKEDRMDANEKENTKNEISSDVKEEISPKNPCNVTTKETSEFSNLPFPLNNFPVNTNTNKNKINVADKPCCLRCKKRNLKCEYILPSKKRGPKTRNAKMSVENLVT